MMAKAAKHTKKKIKWQSKANAERIFALMREGKSLREICHINEWPNSSVNDWLKREFAGQYAQAQEERADFFFDEILDIANSTPDDKEAVQAAKLKIDTRKWIMGRMNPKKYGEKVNVDMSGEAKVTHDGVVELAPNDMAIQRIDEIIGRAIGAGKNERVEDAGEE